MDISVVVPSHDRPLYLRWLLNALEDQTLESHRWEVIVGHDSVGEETEELLQTHPLGKKVPLRSIRFPPGTALPGTSRNAGWQAAKAPLIAFTDDDCRPTPDWLERAVAAARRHPGAIVQGATAPDVDAISTYVHAPWRHSQAVNPPTPWAEACNIIYPRSVLEVTGGWPEDIYGGEDTALAEMARELGTEYVGARDVVTYHAVTERTLLGMLRAVWRYRDMPLLVRRHPRLREELAMWMFWRRTHALLPLAALGWAQMRRTRLAAILLLPYLAQAMPRRYGQTPRGRARTILRTPGCVVLDVAEVATLAWGSIKHRTLFL